MNVDWSEPMAPVRCYGCKRLHSQQRAKFHEAFPKALQGTGPPDGCDPRVRERWAALPDNQRTFELAGIQCIMCRSMLTSIGPDIVPIQANSNQAANASAIPRPSASSAEPESQGRTLRWILAR